MIKSVLKAQTQRHVHTTHIHKAKPNADEEESDT